MSVKIISFARRLQELGNEIAPDMPTLPLRQEFVNRAKAFLNNGEIQGNPETIRNIAEHMENNGRYYPWIREEAKKAMEQIMTAPAEPTEPAATAD